MNLISRYIARQFGSAFLVCLVVLTVLAWMVGALRDFNLMTAQGQSLLVFLAISSLALPALVVVVAPLALFLAMVWLLGRLNSGSELVVLNAAGYSPARLIAPFTGITTLVAAGLATITLYGQPASQHELTAWRAAVGADIVAHLLKEGRFTTVRGLTVHIRERQANGTLLGIFVQDARSSEQTVTYIAERGQVVEKESNLFLVLEKGSLQRQKGDNDNNASIVVFQRYAFDLSQLIGDSDGTTYYKPRDRYTSELLQGHSDNPVEKGRIRGELVDRFTAPLYPFAFMLIALAALGQARTTRQGRAGAIAAAVIAVISVRLFGFVATQSLSVHSPAGAYIAFSIPLLASLVAFMIIMEWIRPRMPAFLASGLNFLSAIIARRTSRA